MAGPDNIAGQGFHTNPERRSNGRPKGSKNRSTILRQFLELPLKSKPSGHDNIDLPEGMTLEDAIHLALIRKAQDGDVAAIKEIQDTLHGKMKETVESTHTFTQMGNVKIGGGKHGEEALDFDVGKETDVVSEEDDAD